MGLGETMNTNEPKYTKLLLGRHTLYCGDNLEVMKDMEDNSIDAIVTDPPYALVGSTGTKGFMGMEWDGSLPGKQWADECLRVLKPGGHLIAFGAARTYHRLVCTLEDAGFQVRDTINWLYFSGFPKSLNVSAAIDKHFGAEREIVGNDANFGKSKDKIFGDYEGTWDITKPTTKEAKEAEGIGTALKPAFEPATLCRKPLSEKTVALNWLRWKTGGLNIDKSRFQYGDSCWVGPQEHKGDPKGKRSAKHDLGRWPANIYQCPKASRSERELGCERLPPVAGHEAVQRQPETAGLNNPRAGSGRTADQIRNHHPTVKPIKLMRWLVKLVCPENGIVLDMFAGSGSTLIAAELENLHSIGIEQSPDYCQIIEARVNYARGSLFRWADEYRS